MVHGLNDYVQRVAKYCGVEISGPKLTEISSEKIISKTKENTVCEVKLPEKEISLEPKILEQEQTEVLDGASNDELPDDEHYAGQRSILLVKYLDSIGAGKRWVKASYSDIGAQLNITPPSVKLAIDDALEAVPTLRVCRVMSGPMRGNNFTFVKDLPEPDNVEQPTPVELVNSAVNAEAPKFEKGRRNRNSDEKDLSVDRAADELLAFLFDRKTAERSPVFILRISEAAKHLKTDERMALNALTLLRNENNIKIAASRENDPDKFIVTVMETA